MKLLVISYTKSGATRPCSLKSTSFQTFNFLLSYSCTISHFGGEKKVGFLKGQRLLELLGEISMTTVVKNREAQPMKGRLSMALLR